MNRQRWVARAVLLVAVGTGALTTTSAAPVPKVKPRDSTILMMSGYPDVPPRLLRADGTLIGELPFKSGWDGAVSPDGTRVAVILRSDNLEKKPVCVVRVGAGQNDIGLPLLTAGMYSSIAWGGSGRVYVNECRNPPGQRNGFLRPDRVTVCDLERGTVTVDKALHGYCIRELSPDGKHLLAQRYVSEPAERWETVLLDAATGKLTAEIGELNCPRFYGSDGLLGSRTKKGAPNDEEYVVYDLTAKRALPLKLPKEVTGETATVTRVLPSPDSKRLLYLWHEDMPRPMDLPALLPGPLRAARMTTCDRDGGNARTIFKPEIKTREDETRNHFGGTIDWR